MNKLEKKFGKIAIPNLTLVIIVACIIGYILEIEVPQSVELLYLNPALIMQGEAWRLISWILIPPTSLGFFTIINLFFYYSLGKTLERIWGDFKYNIFIFSGIFFVIIGAFVAYYLLPVLMPLIGYTVTGASDTVIKIATGRAISFFARTTYLQISAIMAFSLAIPDMQVLMYFILPVRMKWFAAIEGIFLALDLIRLKSEPLLFAIYIIMVLFSLLNFIIVVVASSKRRKVIRNKYKNGQLSDFANEARKRGYRVYASYGNVNNVSSNPEKTVVSRHKCAICGKTEISSPDSIFRFCSKCNGNYEYCDEHLYNHDHK